MNKRIKKKKNKNRIKAILKQLPFRTKRVAFGSGYFIFSFDESSMCWFWLKEFPLWKFGIWLDEKGGYEIFGQMIASIDKFKPSRSELSETNVSGFYKELVLIQNNDPKWQEYIKDNDDWIERYANEYKINQKMYIAITSFITSWNEKQEVLDEDKQVHLELHDRNSKTCSISPRYQVNCLYEAETSKDVQKTFNLGWSVYKQLTAELEGVITADEDYKFMLDDYIFSDFAESISPKNIYDSKQKRYNWKESFDDRMLYVYNYHRRDYDISDEELQQYIYSYNENTEYILLMLKDLYAGRYNVGYARTLCFNKERQERKEREKAERENND